MRQLFLILLLFFSQALFCQQLTTLYDHDGDDFDFRAQSLFATADSLYGVVSTGGANDFIV